MVDGLAGYLQARKKGELFLDLHFLGEIAGLCQGLKFRFMAEMDQDLFDSPRFKAAAEILQRIKDRFDLVPITAHDVRCAVAQRLVRKTPDQKALVEAHLKQFAGFYDTLTGRMAEFVDLFPIHPHCVEIFEKIPFAEQLKALQTLSNAVKLRLDEPVPQEGPGLIACDSLWLPLRTLPALQPVQEVEAVVVRGKLLEKKAAGLFTRPEQQGLAVRLIHALCVHRLVTKDIYARFGASPAELRDQLCLFRIGNPEAHRYRQFCVCPDLDDLLRKIRRHLGLHAGYALTRNVVDETVRVLHDQLHTLLRRRRCNQVDIAQARHLHQRLVILRLLRR